MRSALAECVSPAELRALAQSRSDVRLVDVRTPGEFESASIPGSYNIPLDCIARYAPAVGARVHEPIVLVCQSGQRARQARTALEEAGVRDLRVLDGGIVAWSANGGLVRRGPTRLSLERQVRVVAGGLAALGATLSLVVHPLFALLALGVGAGLLFAGVTNKCGMAVLLTQLPYNRPASTDVDAVVQALERGAPPPPPVHDAHVADRLPSCATG